MNLPLQNPPNHPPACKNSTHSYLQWVRRDGTPPYFYDYPPIASERDTDSRLCPSTKSGTTLSPIIYSLSPLKLITKTLIGTYPYRLRIRCLSKLDDSDCRPVDDRRSHFSGSLNAFRSTTQHTTPFGRALLFAYKH